ncbi:MAG: PIN domain-containing protein [Phycisphaeraceae bacterium]
MNRVFADTSYFIAVLAPDDANHVEAKKWSDHLPVVVTTAWVMTELAAYLAAPYNRALFHAIIASLRNSPSVQFIPASQELFDRGIGLYAARSDKAWSLTDCISFIVMQREGLADALTADRHFSQAGFDALLVS